MLIVESNSSNVIEWVPNQKANPWKFRFHSNEIRELVSNINVAFHQEVRSANSIVDVLAKQWVDRMSPWSGGVA